MIGSADADFLPVVMSSLVTGGYNRFLYNVYDPSYRQLAAPDVASRVDFYALERDPGAPAARTGATYLSSGLGRGLYRTEVDFDCVGEWGAEVFLEDEDEDGEWLTERLRFAVNPIGSTPAIGEAPPLSDSLTASTASFFPSTSPVHWGPRSPLPPLNTASCAPIPVISVRFERGGS